jgi:L-fuculose-phosphate aldolase
MAFAISGRPTDVRTIPESWLLLRELPALPSGTTGQDHEPVLSKLAEGFPAVLIGNDAVLVTGESLLQAFDRLEVAEMTARSLVIGESLGFVSPISNGNIEKLRIAFGIKG